MNNSPQKSPIEFSLLLCTYRNENPLHLKECLDSILSSTVHPNEMVIVKDGPLTLELDEVISVTTFPFETKTIQLPTNQTLGIARREGVNAAKHDWIALMDSDDYMAPNRFVIQLAEIMKNPNIDIIGGQIAEFNILRSQTHTLRKVPTCHTEIMAFAKKRNPFNAMTVMFKKNLAIKSGNFRHFPGFEDYDLWTRMIANGALCQNSSEILVYARTGVGMYQRRRGFDYIKQEWRMQRQLRSLGITTRLNFIKNLSLRIPSRILPKKALGRIYTKFLRKKP